MNFLRAKLSLNLFKTVPINLKPTIPSKTLSTTPTAFRKKRIPTKTSKSGSFGDAGMAIFYKLHTNQQMKKLWMSNQTEENRVILSKLGQSKIDHKYKMFLSATYKALSEEDKLKYTNESNNFAHNLADERLATLDEHSKQVQGLEGIGKMQGNYSHLEKDGKNLVSDTSIIMDFFHESDENRDETASDDVFNWSGSDIGSNAN